jgi:hypothetical protein
MTVPIIQIHKRAEQGQTRPFLCRGSDDAWYYVKGVGAGRRSQISELIAGKLATAFGLPIAPYSIVDVPTGLIQPALDLQLNELGAGLAFGSQVLPFCQELSLSHLGLLDASLRQDVLVFDWWIRNSDRSLTDKGGNPNLLWNGDNDSLVVIDHNLAFEIDMDTNSFLNTHVFKDEINVVFNDWAARQIYHDRLSAAFAAFDKACDDVPEEWWWHADDVPADFDRASTRIMLERFNNDDFWNLMP